MLTAKNSTQLLKQLRKAGPIEVLERDKDTVHLTFAGVDVSIFVLPELAPYVQGQRLTIEGLLATRPLSIQSRVVDVCGAATKTRPRRTSTKAKPVARKARKR